MPVRDDTGRGGGSRRSRSRDVEMPWPPSDASPGSSYSPHTPSYEPVSDTEWITMFERPAFGAAPRMTYGGGYVFGFESFELFATWWKDPAALSVGADFEDIWRGGYRLGSGAFGDVRSVRVVIGGGEYTFAIKKLNRGSRHFMYDLGTFNGNLEMCAAVMPTFDCGGAEPLAPVYHFFVQGARCSDGVWRYSDENAVVCFMGVWTSADVIDMDAERRIVLCDGLDELRAECATAKIAVPDFKLKNIGYRFTDDGAVDFRLLDLESLVFMDSCFSLRGSNSGFFLTMTDFQLRKWHLEKADYAALSPDGVGHLTELDERYQDQLQYVTTGLFFLCIASIAAKQAMGWARLRYDQAPDRGAVLNDIAGACREWFDLALAECRAGSDLAKLVVELYDVCLGEELLANEGVIYERSLLQLVN